MAVPTPTPASPPYSITALEGAVVAFLGSFASSLLIVSNTLSQSAEIGVVAAAAYLGYHAYQSS